MTADWWWGYLAGALTILGLTVALTVISAFALIRGAERGVPMARTWTGDTELTQPDTVTDEEWNRIVHNLRKRPHHR